MEKKQKEVDKKIQNSKEIDKAVIKDLNTKMC